MRLCLCGLCLSGYEFSQLLLQNQDVCKHLSQSSDNYFVQTIQCNKIKGDRVTEEIVMQEKKTKNRKKNTVTRKKFVKEVAEPVKISTTTEKNLETADSYDNLDIKFVCLLQFCAIAVLTSSDLHFLLKISTVSPVPVYTAYNCQCSSLYS